MQQLTLPVSLETQSTLTTFYCIPENRGVVEALRSLEGFCYLWGAQQSGVSHLLQAVVNRSEKGIYLPLKEYQSFSPVGLFDNIEHIPLIVIDDIDLIVGHSDWEQALFHAYNRINDAGHCLVVGAHQPPSTLPIGLADLKSRLSSAVVYRVHELNDETKFAALKWRANKYGLELADDVTQYILNHYSRATSVLFELLESLDKLSLSTQRKVTIPLVKSLLTPHV